tara:strand:- start:737 stop:1480 length:744 start_codon:yes stop_codon:yes gene_type:complete
MFRRRKIPVLLLKNQGLVKTNKFNKRNPKYIGDPINAVKIFNDLRADELVFLDIDASIKNTTISYDLVRDIADEAYMPFAVGGGIKNIKQVETFLKLGAERVIINTSAIMKKNFIKELVNEFGSSSVIVSIDIKKNFFGTYKIYHNCGMTKSNLNLVEYLKYVEYQGAGEIFFQSISNDGTYNGYDVDLIEFVSDNTTIPIIPCGGCSSFENFKDLGSIDGINGYAAGSVFVFFGPRKAVLINYPEK